MLFNDGTFQVQLLYALGLCGYSSFLIAPSSEPFHMWLIANFQLDRWTSTTTTPRSYCAARMRSTCWRTSTRNAFPPRYASAHYSVADAPQTCGTAWSTPSTCCSRGATEHRESAGWRPRSWLSHIFWRISWMYIRWNFCSVGHEPSAQTYMILAMDLRYKHCSCPQELLN